MKKLLISLCLLSFSLILKGDEIPHPAVLFCKTMNVSIPELKLSEKEKTAAYSLALQYINSYAEDIKKKEAGDRFWISVETLMAASQAKTAYALIKLVTDIEEGKKASPLRQVANECNILKFAIAKLQKGSEHQQRFAWMLAYALNQAALQLNPASAGDYSILFAMVDQSVRGMNWRAVQQKKFIPSIITAKISSGDALASGQKLSDKPAFLTSNKAAILNESAISQLYTKTDDKGDSSITLTQLSSKVYKGRSHRSTSFDFNIGLSLNANVSFSEVLGFLSNRYPYMEPYKELVINVPQAINKDSSSSGLGLTLLLLSIYEGFEIDPSIISCADISVNGHILSAYDMTDKLRQAASLKKDGVVIISVSDFSSLLDAFIIWGHSALWNIQVIAARDISEAVNFARKDKTKEYQQGIAEFRKIQEQLRKNPNTLMLDKKTILPQLASVLNKIPTHASARALQMILSGKIPRELSLNTSLDLFSKTCKAVISEVFEESKASASTKNTCLARLQKIKKGLNKSMLPLVTAMEKYINSTKSGESTEADKLDFLREWNDLTKNRKFVDRLR